MGMIFGKKKPASRVTEQDKAVLQLKQQRDKLKQYQKRIERCLEKDREIARKLIHNGQKDRAKLLLRKKRYQEQLLQRTDGQLENLERLTQDIEFAQVELQVLNGLKQGNEALKKVNEALSIEDVEKIMDETRESIEKQQEIDAILNGALTQEDEDAALTELNELIAEEEKENQKNQQENEEEEEEDENINLPEVPDTDITIKVKKSKEEEKERERKKMPVAMEAS